MGENTSGLNPIQASDKAIDAVIRLAMTVASRRTGAGLRVPNPYGPGGYYEASRPVRSRATTQSFESDGRAHDGRPHRVTRDLTVDGAKGDPARLHCTIRWSARPRMATGRTSGAPPGQNHYNVGQAAGGLDVLPRRARRGAKWSTQVLLPTLTRSEPDGVGLTPAPAFQDDFSEGDFVSSTGDAEGRLMAEQSYVSDNRLATVVFLAWMKPILDGGPYGKTELA